jgi:predicted nucleotidyltransferase
MPTFEFKNAQELARVFARHGVRYLFFGKSGAILLGFSDTTQDVDLSQGSSRQPHFYRAYTYWVPI